MARLFALLLVILAALTTVSNGASAQQRFALVIGNSQYRAVTPLANPARDADAITEFLKTAGFEVTSARDLDQAAMRRAFSDFAATLADKGEDTVALVYFAGHGLQLDGENYLLPVDAKIGQEVDVAIEGVRFADVMSQLDGIRSRTRIVILDACRNNPFADGDSAHGLAIVNAPAGSLVAYSTSPGATAADGSGANSPFTTALLTAAREPGTPIEATLKAVRLAVHSATDGGQIPWEVSSLVRPFSFFAGEAPAEREPARKKSAEAWHQELKSRSPEDAYQIVIREDRVIVYQEFLALFPQSPFVTELRELLDRRLEMWAWFEAVTRSVPAGYGTFLKRYPNSDLAATARRLARRAELRSAFASASPSKLGIVGPSAPPVVPPKIVYRDVTKEVKVPVEKIVYKDVIKYRDVIKEVKVPVEKIVYKDVIKYRDVIKEVRVPVEKTVYRDRIKYVPKIIYKDRIKYVPKIVYRTRVVPKIVYRTRTIRVPTPCRCRGGRGNGRRIR